ncbi:leucine aminopeptidase 2, chloroplastic-like [Phalaenopsis equestris]|uniref:leucine aminopeptidase 2, chloroplastic-like n=1 Tax=Phalaenopsis equestris TaxID=78828 RepID=UPI0009E523DF|nr:leucine aminopeptidase 2, chloroplastic-like [Phalaenopsis equestris]
MASGGEGRATLGLTKPVAIEVPQVSFSAKEIDFAEWKGDLLTIAVSEKDISKDEDSKFLNSILKKLDGQLNGLLSEVLIEEDFKGKNGQSVVLRLPGFGFKRLGLVGVSQSTSSSLAAIHREIGEAIAAAAKAAHASSAAIILASTNGILDEFKLTVASAISTGIVLGYYEDNRYKSESKKFYLKSVDIIGLGSGPEFDKKLKYSNAVSSGIIFAKELVNSPANVLTPAILAEEASKIASTYSDVFTAKILDVEQCTELKMGSYLGVGAASSNPPHFIHLCYRPPNGDVKTKIAIVGKGLTFDSGGYNLKVGPACSIDTMKFDMGGSAAAFGAAKVIGQIKPPGVEVHFIVAACENMISGTGMRPGDIVTASNGKTIEVNNTDAEGRLTLADALVYACNLGVEKIVDLATLTGACIVALGPSIAGIFTPNDELAKEIAAASMLTGEKFWRLPLEESYWESMKSSVADMANSGGRHGGAILAALFLKQFVDEKVQWMHIDVAGPVWNDKKRIATGFGVSTLVEWVLKNSS